MPSNHAIAQKLPDLPRWVEVRDLLLGDSGEIFGLQAAPDLSFVLREAGTGSVFVVGSPAAEAIRAVLQPTMSDASVIAPQEHAAWLARILPAWRQTRIIVHELDNLHRLPKVPVGAVNFLDPSALSQLSIEAELRQELQKGAEQSLIAATFVNQQPVSFCYAGAMTESLWDVSIDTLPEYRRRGYAALCVTHLIRYMLARGKRPVWQAVEDNPASWRLAQKLGFVPVDELALFEPHRGSSDA